jgi:TRAP-type C4-dicarboxylate transport system permease small subunit
MGIDSFFNPLDWLFYVLVVGGVLIFAVFVIISVVRRFQANRTQEKGHESSSNRMRENRG